MQFFIEIFEEIFNVHGVMTVSYFIYDWFYYLFSGWEEFRITDWLYIFSTILIPILSLILFHIFNKLKICITTINKFNIKNMINKISLFYLFFPGWYFLYPILLSILNINIQKQLKFVFLGSIIYHFYLYVIYELSHVNSILVNNISIIRFFPLFILLFFIWKPFWLIKNIFKYISIIILVLVFFTQPFYKQWFYENNKASNNQGICYDREKVFWPCFKIFKGIRIN